MKYEKHALRATIKGEGKEGKTIGGKSIYFYDWMQLRRQRFSVMFSAIFQTDKKTIDKYKFSTTDQLRLYCIAFSFSFLFSSNKNGDFKHFLLFVFFFVLAIFFATQRLLLSHIQSFLQKATLTFFHCCKRTFFLESHFWQKLFCNAMILQKLFFKAKNEKQLWTFWCFDTLTKFAFLSDPQWKSWFFLYLTLLKPRGCWGASA